MVKSRITASRRLRAQVKKCQTPKRRPFAPRLRELNSGDAPWDPCCGNQSRSPSRHSHWLVPLSSLSSLGLCFAASFLFVFLSQHKRSITNTIANPFANLFQDVPLGLTGFYRVSPSFPGFYWVLPGFTGFYLVLLGFTGFYWVLPSFIEFYLVLLGFNGFYWVLTSFT